MPSAKAPKAQNGSAGAEEAPFESPVVALLAKRGRNLKKRLRGVAEIEAKRDAGKELNSDQVRSARLEWAAARPGGTQGACWGAHPLLAPRRASIAPPFACPAACPSSRALRAACLPVCPPP